MKVIDNFLNQKDFLELQRIVMSKDFPWFYIEHASLNPEDNNIEDTLAIETPGFNHILFDREWNVRSFTYETMSAFFKKIETEFGFSESDILRARFSMKVPKIGFKDINYNLPHIDYYFPHHTMIYYINDSDGDTRIFDQYYTMTGIKTGIAQKDFTIENQVTPKANRLVWIDGLQYHTASNPIVNNRRIVFNLNLFQS
jgi:hypothetical protein